MDPFRDPPNGLYRLASTLIVGNTLCLGRTGLLGGEGQNDQGNQVGQHPVQVGADADLSQHKHTVTIDIQGGVSCRNALEEAKEQRGQGNITGLPVAENHNGQSQEAEACNITVGGAVW